MQRRELLMIENCRTFRLSSVKLLSLRYSVGKIVYEEWASEEIHSFSSLVCHITYIVPVF